MGQAVRFYEALGFDRLYGGPEAEFTSYKAGDGFLNLQLKPDAGRQPVWGRVIFWVADVDGMHQKVVDSGYRPSTRPADAPWGERYFHVRDPDGHELSFAAPISRTDGVGDA
jgi:hypothetical protein